MRYCDIILETEATVDRKADLQRLGPTSGKLKNQEHKTVRVLPTFRELKHGIAAYFVRKHVSRHA